MKPFPNQSTTTQVFAHLRTELLLRLLPKQQPVLVRYALTAAFVGVAFSIRYFVGENAGPYAFLIFVPSIVLSALLFDRGTGFFAIILSVVLLGTLLPWGARSGTHVAAFSLFVVVSSFLVFIAEGLHRALEASQRAHEATALLLEEMSHRVKNKFAVIAAIIALEGRNSPPEARKALENVGSRVKVIAAVHDYLQRSRHEGHIEMSEYLSGLCQSLDSALGSSARAIRLSCSSAQLRVSPDKALAVGLLVNALVTNAFKYAFDSGGGHVRVTLEAKDSLASLTVSDDGKGCPKQPTEGLGTRLVKTFAEQLGGSANWNEGQGSGCVATVQFPISSS